MAMEKLASETGGKAFFHTNDLNGSLRHAVADGSHYYTIAYTPAKKRMDGEYRKVEVKVAAGNYNLAYRRGYYADDTAAPASKADADPLRPLLKRGLPGSTELVYYVRAIPLSPQPGPNAARAGFNAKLTCPCTRYRLDFRIPWTAIAFKPAPDGGRSGKIDAGLIAYDGDGNAVNWMSIHQEMNMTAEQFAAIQKSTVPARIEIDLPNNELHLATGVYDWDSGKAGSLEIPLHPAADPATATPPPAQIKPTE
jgi:hypothetical protein